MAKITLETLGSGYQSTSNLNDNFTAIETALNNLVLYRDNPDGEANSMQNDFDMNSNRILNLPTATANTEPVRYDQFLAASGSLTINDALAENVDYTPAGSGAVTRDVQAKLREFGKSSGDYTLDSTGTTDCRAEFQSLATAASGGKLLLGSGTFLIGASGSTMAYRATTANIGVDLPSNIVIEGQGFNTILKPADSSDAVPLCADTKSKITLRNFIIQGNGANQTSDRAFGVYFLNCSEIEIDNVWFYDTYSNTLELIGCDKVQLGKTYHETTSASSIGGGPQLEDCTNVTIDQVLGSTYDDLVSIISHAADSKDITINNVNGKSEQARALFIGQSGSAAAQYTMENITAKVNSHECGVSGLTAAFTMNRGGIYKGIDVKVVDRDSYTSFRCTPYDATYSGQLINCKFDIESRGALDFGIDIRHDDTKTPLIENNELRAIVKNANVNDTSIRDAVRIQGGDFWDIDLNIDYGSGKTNAGRGVLLGGTGTNNIIRRSTLKAKVTAGSPNIQVNNCNELNLDPLVLHATEEANNINLDITSNANNVRIGSVIRDGEIQDLGAGTQRNIVKLYSSGARISTSGTGEDDLASYSLAADWMGKTGVLHIKASGTYQNVAGGNKTLKFHFGTQSVTMHGPGNYSGDWNADIYITQFSNRASQRIDASLLYGNSVVFSDKTTSAVTTTAAVTVKFTGECANASDSIDQDSMLIEGY